MKKTLTLILIASTLYSCNKELPETNQIKVEKIRVIKNGEAITPFVDVKK